MVAESLQEKGRAMNMLSGLITEGRQLAYLRESPCQALPRGHVHALRLSSEVSPDEKGVQGAAGSWQISI